MTPWYPQPMSETSEFLSRISHALDVGTFVKVTLSDPEGDVSGMRNLKARVVELKAGRRLGVTECYPTREIVKNHLLNEGATLLGAAFEAHWRRAHLFTTTGDFQFRRERSGLVTIRASRPTFSEAGSLRHDKRNAEQAAVAAEPYLERLGVTNHLGAPRPGMAGKLRQVQRFTELLGHLLDEFEWAGDRPLRVADMGAGKGYLTFALYRALTARGIRAEVIGVEQREELVKSANELSRDLGFEGLRFEAGRIGEWKKAEGLDVLVALHACNTATDEALFQGISLGAELLVTSPCCHQELRPQMASPNLLRSVMAHGILEERYSEILTDGLRALLLELAGYRARVFEFVEPEHSGKNLMLAAVRRKSGGRDTEAVRSEALEIMNSHRIKTQRLAALMGVVS